MNIEFNNLEMAWKNNQNLLLCKYVVKRREENCLFNQILFQFTPTRSTNLKVSF